MKWKELDRTKINGFEPEETHRGPCWVNHNGIAKVVTLSWHGKSGVYGLKFEDWEGTIDPDEISCYCPIPKPEYE